MTETVCLNVVRHPALPVARGQETYDERVDPAAWAANDDIHPTDGPAGVDAAVPRLLLDPGRPLHIRHSPTVRTRKGAELFAERLRATYDIRLTEDAALAELEYDRRLTWTREEHESPAFGRMERVERLYQPMLADDHLAFPGGHQRLRAAIAALQHVLATEGLVNHLWVSHGLMIPFIWFGVVEKVPPQEWSVERALAVPVFTYATGFHVRVPVSP